MSTHFQWFPLTFLQDGCLADFATGVGVRVDHQTLQLVKPVLGAKQRHVTCRNQQIDMPHPQHKQFQVHAHKMWVRSGVFLKMMLKLGRKQRRNFHSVQKTNRTVGECWHLYCRSGNIDRNLLKHMRKLKHARNGFTVWLQITEQSIASYMA